MSVGCCVDCADGKLCEDAVLIRVIEQGPGPGHAVYACPAHARVHAKEPGAADWLRGDIAGPDDDPGQGAP